MVGLCAVSLEAKGKNKQKTYKFCPHNGQKCQSELTINDSKGNTTNQTDHPYCGYSGWLLIVIEDDLYMKYECIVNTAKKKYPYLEHFFVTLMEHMDTF